MQPRTNYRAVATHNAQAPALGPVRTLTLGVRHPVTVTATLIRDAYGTLAVRWQAPGIQPWPHTLIGPDAAIVHASAPRRSLRYYLQRPAGVPSGYTVREWHNTVARVTAELAAELSAPAGP